MIDGPEGIMSVENLNLWNEVPMGWGDDDWEMDEYGPDCDPMDHEGNRSFVFVIGSYGDSVIGAEVCTACGMATNAWTINDIVTSITLQGHLGLVDSVSNNPFDTETVSHDLDDLVDWDDVDAEEPCVHRVDLKDGEVVIEISDESEDIEE